MSMNNVDDFFENDEDMAREEFIKFIDEKKCKNNLAYQIMLNKFELTPYLYEDDNIDPIFNNYKNVAKSNISNIILHPYQLKILNSLESGDNVVVSAPTSFGKTASIFDYISRHKNDIKKILIIVPTIALRNEYIEKINICLSDHSIITNHNDLNQYNSFCMILTHERFVEYFMLNKSNGVNIDLLVIDEIYKLQNENDMGRIFSMSLAYLTAIKISKQFIFLGPFINSIKLPDISNYKELKYNYSPIATNIKYVPDVKFDVNSLKSVVVPGEKTLVYFSSKSSLLKIANELNGTSDCKDMNKELIDFIEKEYGKEWIEEWSVIKALKNGIGIHYNEVPSFIKDYVINSYNNSDDTMVLFATSTLLEGVNTATKKIVITSNKIGSGLLTDFEFWNLVGRAGRLGKYKVGEVVYFGNEDDYKKEKRYIDLNNLWINRDENKDEYDIVNIGFLTNAEKQSKLNQIMYIFNISVDEIIYVYLPFFSKIDSIIDFFDNVYPKVVTSLKNTIKNNTNDYTPSRNIRKIIFDDYLKKYKNTISYGPLPTSHFYILSDAIDMRNTTRTEKIKYIVNNGRNKVLNSSLSGAEIIEKMDNLYNFSFYMVNNYVENAYIPGVSILKNLFENNNIFSETEYGVLYNAIFKQVEKYKSMIQDDDIYETLGVISPLVKIIKKFVGSDIKNISELKRKIEKDKEKIENDIIDNNLYMHYFNLLVNKLKI